MKINRNLKQRMLIKESKNKLKNKMKKLACLSAVAAMVASMINPQALVYAASIKNTNQIIENKVEYNEDYSKASIKFDVDSIDKERYELISITSDKENTVIYDKDKITEEDKSKAAIYEVVENGDYSFTVKYSEKQEEERANKDVIKVNVEDTGMGDVENKALLNSNTENQDEIKISESSKVQEEKFILNINGIKNLDVSEEKENNFNENVYLNNDNESPTILNENINSRNIINLNREFNISGVMQDDSGYIGNITSSHYSVSGNTIRLGFPSSGYKRQTIVLTNKNSIDYNRDFKLKGKMNISSRPEGFTIAFHNTPNYRSSNSGGSMGVYSDKRDVSSVSDGIGNALIMEVDTYNNTGATPVYEDNPYYDEGGNGKHLAISKTDSKGIITNNLRELYDTSRIDELLYKDTNFEVSWEASKNKLIFTFGNLKIESIDNEMGRKLKASPGYYSISSGLNFGIDGRGNNNKIIFEEFKYVDTSPNISTNYKVKSGKGHAIPGEKVTITHEMWNSKATTVQIKDKLNLKNMKIDSEGNNLQISNIKKGTNLNNLTPVSSNVKFDSNTPLEVVYPANKGKYYVQYDVTIPTLEKHGRLSKLNCEVLLGQEGMSQISSSKTIDIKNKPALYTKKGSSLINKSQIIKVSKPTEVTKELLWKDLYAKVALSSSSEYKINVEDSGTDTMTFEWEYQVNGSKVDSFPEQIEKGNICSLKLKVIDKSDNRLNNEFNRIVIVEEDMVQTDDYYIYAENSTPISETKLVTLTEDEFKNYVKTESKAKAFKVNSQTGLVENKNVEVKLDGWLDNQGEPYKRPGNSTIELYVTEKSSVKKVIGQEVTENTWSYDTKDRTEENGASGFIVIPKGIDLEGGSGDETGKLIGRADVYFADYSVSNASYKLHVDKTFDLIKKNDLNSRFTVTSSARGASDSDMNRLYVGDIDYRYGKRNPVKINFEAPRTEVDKSRGRWEGKVKFYFERKS